MGKEFGKTNQKNINMHRFPYAVSLDNGLVICICEGSINYRQQKMR